MLTTNEFAVVFVMDDSKMKERILAAPSTSMVLLEENILQELRELETSSISYEICTLDDNLLEVADKVRGKMVLVRGTAHAVSKFKEVTAGQVDLFIDTTIVKWPKKVVKAFSSNANVSTYKDVVKKYYKPTVLEITQPTTELVTPRELTTTTYVIKSQKDLESFANATKFLPVDYPVVVKELTDSKTDVESYRSVISNFYVSSIANKSVEHMNTIPGKDVVNFLMDFANQHKHFPNSYIVDISVKDKTITVDAVIDLESGERYSKNSFDRFLQFIID